MGIALLALSLILVGGPAPAQEKGCAPPPSLAAWAEADGPTTLTLGPVDTVAWRRAPEREPTSGSRGGVMAFTVAAAGVHQVAIADSAWIDVVGPDGFVASVEHGHGDPCTGIRKIVAFDLTPGDYVLQLSGAEAESTHVLIAPRPTEDGR